MNMSILVLKCGLNDTCIFLLVNLVRMTYLIIYQIEQKNWSLWSKWQMVFTQIEQLMLINKSN